MKQAFDEEKMNKIFKTFDSDFEKKYLDLVYTSGSQLVPYLSSPVRFEDLFKACFVQFCDISLLWIEDT